MLGLTFDLGDIPRVFFLGFLEILLSGDNAIVLGLLASKLSEPLRKKALLIGVVSAFFFRALALLFISFLIRYQWVLLIGAAYLIYLSLRYFTRKKKKDPHPLKGHSFWQIVLMIELFDLAFALDSILAGIAFISDGPKTSFLAPKLWIVYAGGMLGLIGIRYAAHLFTHLIHRFPGLEKSAYLMVGWIGLKLGYSTFPNASSEIEPIFWTVMVFLFFLGFRNTKKAF